MASSINVTTPTRKMGEKEITVVNNTAEAQLLDGSFLPPYLVTNWTNSTFEVGLSKSIAQELWRQYQCSEGNQSLPGAEAIKIRFGYSRN